MNPMTGAGALRMMKALNAAALAAGTGERRGLLLLEKMHELGWDVVTLETAPGEVPGADRERLAAE